MREGFSRWARCRKMIQPTLHEPFSCESSNQHFSLLKNHIGHKRGESVVFLNNPIFQNLYKYLFGIFALFSQLPSELAYDEFLLLFEMCEKNYILCIYAWCQNACLYCAYTICNFQFMFCSHTFHISSAKSFFGPSFSREAKPFPVIFGCLSLSTRFIDSLLRKRFE